MNYGKEIIFGQLGQIIPDGEPVQMAGPAAVAEQHADMAGYCVQMERLLGGAG